MFLNNQTPSPNEGNKKRIKKRSREAARQQERKEKKKRTKGEKGRNRKEPKC